MGSNERNPYKVYISSVEGDNPEWFEIAKKAINGATMTYIKIPASTTPNVTERLKNVEEADLLVGIIGHRYGWIPENGDKSITEMEYDAAEERLMFLRDDGLPIIADKDQDPPGPENKQHKLYLFKEKIKQTSNPAVFEDNDLQGDVFRALEQWKKTKTEQQPDSPCPDEIQSDYTHDVYIGAYSDDMKGVRKRLCNDLETKEVSVFKHSRHCPTEHLRREIPYGIPPPFDLGGEHYKNDVKDVMKRARVVLHLLGQWEGERVPGGNTHLREQVKIASKCAGCQIIWVPDGLDYEKVTDEGYRNYLKKIEERLKSTYKHFLRGSDKTLLDELLDELEIVKQSENAQIAPLDAVLDYHDKDKKLGSQVHHQLVDQEFNVKLSDDNSFKELLRRTGAYVILCKDAGTTWLNRRLEAAKKVTASFEVKENQTKQWLGYLLPPKRKDDLQVEGVEVLYNDLNALFEFLRQKASERHL